MREIIDFPHIFYDKFEKTKKISKKYSIFKKVVLYYTS